MLPTTKKTNSKKKNKDNKGKGFRFMGVDFGKDRTKGKVEAKGGGRLTDKNNSAIVLDSKTKTKRKVKKAKDGGRLTDKNNSAIVLDSKTKTKRKVKKAKSGGKVRNTKNAKPKDKPTPPIDKGAVERGNRMSKMEAGSAKAMNKKMGGGQVMKYKKGGIVYKKHGGVVKAAGGDNFVSSCYD